MFGVRVSANRRAGRFLRLWGAGMLVVALAGCGTASADGPGKSSTPSGPPSSTEPFVPHDYGDPVTPAPFTPAPTTPPVAAKPDCTPPTVQITDFRSSSEPVTDVDTGTVYQVYNPFSITVRFTNRSKETIAVDYVSADVMWRTKPHADRNLYWVSPMTITQHVDGSASPPHQLRFGQSSQDILNVHGDARIRTGSGGVSAANAKVDWTFVNPTVESACRH